MPQTVSDGGTGEVPQFTPHVSNRRVRRLTRRLFVVALLFFLVNIALGFLNVFGPAEIPHWQILTHLHAASLGWITLSAIAIGIWLFTGDRPVSDGYVRTVRLLGWLAILAFAAYVASFAIGFSQAGDALLLLPVFGAAAMLVTWAVAAYALAQLRHQAPVTSIHVLLTAGYLVLALGALMGVLLGSNHAMDVGISAVAAHAPVMLFYLLPLGAAIVEWVVSPSAADGWTWPGLVQAAAAVVGGVIPPVAFLFGLEFLAPILLVMLVVFTLLFLGRVGWRALVRNPYGSGVYGWTFFGTVWLVVGVAAFPTELVLSSPPAWLLPVLAHVLFVGMTTNLLFGVIALRAREWPELPNLPERTAMWLLNLGVLAFVVVLVTSDTRHGALLMGAGVLLGALAGLYHLTVGDPSVG